MNRRNCLLDRPNESELARVIEPLASFICATKKPKAALISALAILFNEVEQTNRAASAHVLNLLETQSS
jgi:hypothetical protein